jgi:hypothetical protein
MKLLLGDCLDKLKELDDNSVDSIVTDPPYGLGFMGKAWDTFDKSQFGKQGEEGENDLKNKKGFKILPRYNTDGLYDFAKAWASECLRVLKPGGHLLSFAGSRTYHKICMGIEDAGFEIRDQIMWIYGTGFPKSMNISKMIDKSKGVERGVVGYEEKLVLESGRGHGRDKDGNVINKGVFVSTGKTHLVPITNIRWCKKMGRLGNCTKTRSRTDCNGKKTTFRKNCCR